ncbi:unnamed protein product [Adineta ricciae]|uniref:Uncharacterized protein n=1 Tax=Adineta ricciae TaxID=249248 RepID=A0A815Y7J3_ADIRI|nr:unnamed protein product [Adineta ricciae]CAF1567120.1 unnamed protein product [Adineta ricciae]
MINRHQLRYTYLFFWLFIIEIQAGVLDDAIIIKNANTTPIFFRWSQGFGVNGRQIRCATDQSSEDPFGRFPEAYPERKGFSNSSLFMYNPQTRRVRLVGNGHCLVVNQISYHDDASKEYPANRILKSVDCKQTAANESTSSLIWGSEFRFVSDNNNRSNMALRFISPTDGHEWTIYNKGYMFIVADIIQQRVDDLIEPWLEIVNNYMSHD